MTTATHPLMPSPTGMVLWRVAQLGGVLATVVLITGLFISSEIALLVLWNVLIPLVPASLLISPAVWRNVCPLATLNLLSNRSPGRRVLNGDMLRYAGIVGITLLLVMVPARRFLFNTDGAALAVTVIAVALLAVLLGLVFDVKAGFCNAICPVLPVERLYGQHPLLRVPNPRCDPCSVCTSKGCIDLSPVKSIAQTLGNARRSHAWLFTGYGAFAAAFPGFVIGYYTTQDGPLATAASVYLHVALWMVGSYVVSAALVRLVRLRTSVAFFFLATVAVALYYWFAAPVISTAFGVGDLTVTAIRVGAFAVLAVWVWRAWPVVGSSNWKRPSSSVAWTAG